MDFDRDAHPIKRILFSLEARIQSVQATDGSFEQRFGLNLGGVFDSKAVQKFDDAVPLEH